MSQKGANMLEGKCFFISKHKIWFSMTAVVEMTKACRRPSKMKSMMSIFQAGLWLNLSLLLCLLDFLTPFNTLWSILSSLL